MIEKELLGLSAAGFHRITYTERGGDGPGRPVVCVHGLTRNGRDFDMLADALAAGRRVVCPDVVGRGRSGWLSDPAGYGYPQYLADMTALIARLDTAEVDWIGTSMGGLIGMLLAARPNSPVRRLVLNDVGPFVPRASLERIAGYVGNDPHFDSLDGAEAYLRSVHAPFGPLTDGQWRHLAEHGVRLREGGGYALHYDPGIAEAFRAAPLEDVDLWPIWEAIRCPVLLVRGAESDLLPADVAEEMTRRGPRAERIDIAGCGHAPALMADDQVAAIRDWLTPEA